MKAYSKIVMNKVIEHIKEYYEDIEDLRKTAENLIGYDNVYTNYQAGVKMTQSGCFLCYYSDAREFLDTLELNNNSNKEFSDEKVWEMYCHLVGKGVEKLLKK